jgi:hypothetical protein
MRRVEIHRVGRTNNRTGVRVAMSGTADPETGVRISARAPKIQHKTKHLESLEEE